jgi:hypothetical protein
MLIYAGPFFLVGLLVGAFTFFLFAVNLDGYVGASDRAEGATGAMGGIRIGKGVFLKFRGVIALFV